MNYPGGCMLFAIAADNYYIDETAGRFENAGDLFVLPAFASSDLEKEHEKARVITWWSCDTFLKSRLTSKKRTVNGVVLEIT
eukprot:scaffold148514_cov81-Cyclotella_meneghiniana.AAC.2